MSGAPAWLNPRALRYLHEESLATFGGASGIRDEGLLESALARPINQHLYKPDSDIAELAAAYAYGIAKNHPFVDGNKRAAFLALGLFLNINGWTLTATPVQAIETVLSLATGTLTESALAAWIRDHSEPIA